jgi:MFS family permease
MQSPARAWWFVALLCLASLLSVIDRGIVNLVVDPLRQELALTEVQVGLLQGLAFGIVYAVGGVLLGVWADRHHRRNLIVFGIVVWSLATAWAGVATSFGELFAARLIVGLGEAALAPAAVSLIADLFPADRRGRPMGFYMAGQALANGLAISLTGLVIAAAAAQRFAPLGLPSTWTPWRVTFVLCGATGIVVVLALLTCREPARSAVSPAASLLEQGRDTLRQLVERRKFFLPLYLGFAVCFTAVYGAAGWMPTMLGRVYGLDPRQLAQSLGPMTMAFAIAGPLLGGVLIDRLVRRYGDRGRLQLVAGVTLLAIPSGLAAFVDDSRTAVLLVASSSAVYPFVGLCVITALQSQWPPPMRGLGIALTGLFNTAIGAVFGPLLISYLTQHVLRDDHRVGESIAWVVLPCLLIAAVLFWIAARAVDDRLPEMQRTAP